MNSHQRRTARRRASGVRQAIIIERAKPTNNHFVVVETLEAEGRMPRTHLLRVAVVCAVVAVLGLAVIFFG